VWATERGSELVPAAQRFSPALSSQVKFNNQLSILSMCFPTLLHCLLPSLESWRRSKIPHDVWKMPPVLHASFCTFIHPARSPTRRPASANRTARRDCVFAVIKLFSRYLSRLPRYEAKYVQRTCFQWGLVPLRSMERSYPLQYIYIKPLERQMNALQLCRWQFLYNTTLQQTSRLYCRNCPKDDKFRYLIPILRKLWGSVEPWLMARWKARDEFLLSVIELLYRWGATRQNVSKLTAFWRRWVSLSQDFREKGSSLGNIFFWFLEN